jgi:hypothetical protein
VRTAVLFGTRVSALAAVLLAALGAALNVRAATAAPGLMVGATEDMFKLEPALAGSVARDLGLRAARVSLHWDSWQTSLKAEDAADLQAAVSTGPRVIVAVYGWHNEAPQDAASRDRYCAYVRDLLVQVPRINDVVIWNEPNISYFWRPQYTADGESASPAAYEALLARCWDVLHALRPNVSVIAPATSPWGNDDPNNSVVIAHSPVVFIRKLGEAYRASGRTDPIFDTVGHHVYGAAPGERPWRDHPYSRRISQGDLRKLVNLLQEAFGGTRQPVPGMPVNGRAAPVWYLESGFETTPPAEKAPLYRNRETTSALPDSVGALPWTVLPDPSSQAPDQATQLRDAVRLAYCQPYVEGIFNFLLRDQEDLVYWQSGVLWADRTPKGSYGAYRTVIAEAASGTVDCSLFGAAAGAPPPGVEEPQPSTVRPEAPTLPQPVTASDTHLAGTTAATDSGAGRRFTVKWVRQLRRAYGRRNVDWRIAVRATLEAQYVARIVNARGRPTLTVRGMLVNSRVTAIRFPRRALIRGKYRVVLQLRAPHSLTLRSRPFLVLAARSS